MSTAASTIGSGGSHGGPESGATSVNSALARISTPVERFLSRIPVEDWITFGLLGIMLAAVGWAVQLAEWGDLPAIIPTLLMGWIAGFVASRDRLPVAANIMLAALIGFAVVMWQGSIPADGENVALRARDAWDRFWEWINVAQEGGISNDSVPFALMFMTAAWVTAYTVTSLTFRVRNPWTPIVLLSMGLMSNLSFRPGLHEHTFYIYIVAAIALFAHLTAVRRMDRWREKGISYPAAHSWISMSDGLLFGGIVALLVVLMPIFEPRSSTLNGAWDVLKAPIDALEEPANRLLSGVKVKDGAAGFQLPDQVLTFKGEIELTEEPLAWVTSRYATMLPGRVYDTYASSGWLANSEVRRSVTAREQMTAEPQEQGRERLEQLIQPLVETNLLLPAGGAFSVDRDAEIEYLQPESFRVPLTGTVAALADLPDDVRQMAFDTRSALRDTAAEAPDIDEITLNNQPLMTQAQVLEALAGKVTPEVEIRLEKNTSGDVTHLDVRRIGPDEPVGGVFTEPLEAQRLYNVTSFVVTARDDQLSAAGDEYPAWVTDRYLALPDSLPFEVRSLANEIVRATGARTAYEKTRAIQTFLQSQEYSLEIDGPATNQDGVYYFLFETQDEPCPSDNPDCDASRIKGYSQYYGSAGTVLLRAAGVPARMVAGWATGDYVPAAGKFLIRDEHRHGWTQAYFAGYGWVDIEVTPGRQEPERGRIFSVEPSGTGSLPAIGAIEDDPDFQADIASLDELARRAREAALAEREALLETQKRGVPWTTVILISSVAGLIVAVMIGWNFWHRGMSPAEKAYTKMVRAGWLLGVRRKEWQTPTEFARSIGDVAPGVAESAMIIASQFERRRYARFSQEEAGDLPGRWRHVLRGLMGYRARLIGGAGPELGEGRESV